jgi:hypothetical protein
MSAVQSNQGFHASIETRADADVHGPSDRVMDAAPRDRAVFDEID